MQQEYQCGNFKKKSPITLSIALNIHHHHPTRPLLIYLQNEGLGISFPLKSVSGIPFPSNRFPEGNDFIPPSLWGSTSGLTIIHWSPNCCMYCPCRTCALYHRSKSIYMYVFISSMMSRNFVLLQTHYFALLSFQKTTLIDHSIVL